MNNDGLLDCDIVMKGGVTSGVVYPAAVVALAKTYRFRNIGGTSAGAIASVVTAAAEYSRRTGNGTGFTGLEALPAWLASQGHLPDLFRPNKTTRAAFSFLMRLLASPQGENKFFAALVSLFASYRVISILSAVPGALLVWLGITYGHGWIVAIGAALLLAVPVGLPSYLLFRCVANSLPDNLYGLCTGLSDTDPNDTTVLTSWLADLIDVVAGVDKRPEPLTFGDLWSAGGEVAHAASPRPASQQDADQRDAELEARTINLEMMTTNITHGRPYRFPFETKIFYFDPSEFQKLFPSRIVDWMVAKTRGPEDPDEAARMRSALPLLPLPEAADIPIVVAARMSLSFPFLLSAVPLHAVDWGDPKNQQHRTSPKFEPCWFSDGGLSSNFPNSVVRFADSKPANVWNRLAEFSGVAGRINERSMCQRVDAAE